MSEAFRERSEPGSFRRFIGRRIIKRVLAGAIVTTAAASGGVVLVSKSYQGNIQDAEDLQIRTIELVREDKGLVPIETDNFKLQEGAVYRHNPASIGRKWGGMFGLLDGNEAGRVPNGQELILINPISRVDPGSAMWLDAEIRTAEDCLQLDTTSTLSHEQVAANYISVNYGALSNQKYDDDMMYAERLELPGGSGDPVTQASFNAAGQLIADGSQKLVACGFFAPAGMYDAIEHALTPLSEK